MHGRHAADEPAEVHVALRADDVRDITATPTRGELAEREAEHVGEDERPALADAVVDAALEVAGVVHEDALAGREQFEAEGPLLAADFEVTAQEDEPRPGDAAIAGAGCPALGAGACPASGSQGGGSRAP